jgi:hypothetical protein
MGILGALFGGSKQKSSNESGNNAYGFLSGALQPSVGTGTNALNTLSSGVGGSFTDYLKNAGFDTALKDRLTGITGAGAARGLLNSGATGRAAALGEGDLRSQFYNNWLGKLGDVAQLGIGGAGGLLAGAGSYSKGTSKGSSQGGILSTLFG